MIGEDVIVEEPGGAFTRAIFASTAGPLSPASLTRALGSPRPAGPLLRFGRMFKTPHLQEYRPPSRALIELGDAMAKSPQEAELDSRLPAGYTYLGQFVDHDLTFDIDARLTTTDELENGATAPELVVNARSPSLDLDSLYGCGPESESSLPDHRKMYQADGASFRVGNTTRDPDGGVLRSFPNDLPRGANPVGAVASRAIIPDPRNDENLPVAQTHVAFIRFHNAVVRSLRARHPGADLFKQARERVVRHYQWIVLRDFLPRIIDEGVLDDVVVNGLRHCGPEPDGSFLIPFEFAFAAYRLGHSLVRDSYDWNSAQSPPGRPTGLTDLFRQIGFPNGTLQANRQLLSAWIIDWRRFFDLRGYDGVPPGPGVNLSRKIDATISGPLLDLPFLGHADQEHRSLAVVNLLRGRHIGLPAGQSVAERIGVENPLTSEEIAGGRQREVLERHGLHALTPLWFYILKEAEVRGGGERLGPVGSRIVAETFVGAIKNSSISILPRETSGGPVWGPGADPLDPERERPERFTMSDLLYFVQRGEQGEFLNPVG